MRSRARCTLCGRPGPFPEFYRRDPWRMVRCPACRLVFQDPQPDEGDLAGAYYFDEGFVRMLEGELRPVVLDRAREKLDLLAGAGVRGPGRLLDVGASTGAWLELARGAGWEGTGVEIGEPAADAARARGLDVRTGTLDQLAPTLDGPFDLITFWDVLEHLPEPVGALRLARSLLAPGGRVAMTFPNVEGWYPRATHRLIARPTGVWEHPELPVHLYDFSPATARRLAREGGLEVERARTTEIPFGFLRDSTLVPQLALSRKRRLVLGPAFGLLRRAIYPAARLMGRGNAQFLLAKG